MSNINDNKNNSIYIYIMESEQSTEDTRAYWRKTSKKYYDIHKDEIKGKRREAAAIKSYEKAIALIEAHKSLVVNICINEYKDNSHCRYIK